MMDTGRYVGSNQPMHVIVSSVAYTWMGSNERRLEWDPVKLTKSLPTSKLQTVMVTNLR